MDSTGYPTPRATSASARIFVPQGPLSWPWEKHTIVMADPQARAQKLRAWCRAQPAPAILVGSSMGGYVALAAASDVGAAGLFLLAPALYVPGYETIPVPPAPTCRITIIHGWQDEVLPWSGSARYGELSGARVILVPDGHRLVADLGGLCNMFRLFLDELGA